VAPPARSARRRGRRGGGRGACWRSLTRTGSGGGGWARRGGYLLRNGRGAALPAGDPLAGAEFLVAAEVAGEGREDRIHLAAALDEAALLEEFGGQVEREEETAWDPEARAVAARWRERLGAIVLREGRLAAPDADAVAAALLEGIAREGIDALPWSPAARQLRERLAFLHALDPAWPDVSGPALLAALPEWLGPYLHGMWRLDDLRRVDLAEALLGRVGWERRGTVDDLAPSHVEVPSGSRVPIDYADPRRRCWRCASRRCSGGGDAARSPAAACRSRCTCSLPRGGRCR
jgi:ATP-dependent helicase HrpB